MPTDRVGRGTTGVSSSRQDRAASSTGHETILLVEDDASLRELAASILSRYGYSVLQAELIEDLDRLGSRVNIDLLLTDIAMPGASGKQFAERCRRLWPGARVLFMSGYPESMLFHDCSLDPGSNFLQKPFAPTALAQKVREVLDSTAGSNSVVA